MIKYIGSKRLLVPRILEIVRSLRGVRTVADLFSGTSRVGFALKSAGYRVIANDSAAYAHALATCYVQADLEDIQAEAAEAIDGLNQLEGRPGYFTETYSHRSRFFRPENGARIDAIRSAIASAGHRPELEAVLLTSLMEAADRVDSTAGVQMAYLKSWAPRAWKPLRMRLPELAARPVAGKCVAMMGEARDAAIGIDADLTYIDPPYNQHSYLSNYHIWETLVRNDEPEVYGKACKRVDCRDRKSPFNSRPGAAPALAELLETVRSRYVLVSFNDEGYLPRGQIEAMLAQHGNVRTWAIPFKRYVGAKIGIHGPDGSRVGTVSHVDNHEHLYLVERRSVRSGAACNGTHQIPNGQPEGAVADG